MIHLAFFIGTFFAAIRCSQHIQATHMHPGNYILIAGFGILMVIIALDYMTEQIQKRPKKMHPRRRFSKVR